MKITVIGTGYVGLVTGVCFAESGNHVVCVDIDENKVNLLRQGIPTIYEPGLETLLRKNLEASRIQFTTNLVEGIQHGKVIFLALPTPPNADGSADLNAVLKTAEAIAKHLTEYKVIVNKSTVPVGTGEKVKEIIKKYTQIEFDVVSNPEFLKEGVAVEDFMKPERVVVGADNPKAFKIMQELYEPFLRSGNPLLEMDIRSAEMTKYAANAFLAMKISFMNEIANLCALVGADVDNVRKGIGTDSRIGKRFIFPGIGYGGSCFPKDVQALYKTAKEYNYDFQILDAVMKVNQKQRLNFIQTVLQHFNHQLKGKQLTIWGLAFKPNTDDIREAPALTIIDALLQEGARLHVHDPEALRNVQKLYGDKLVYFTDPYKALISSEALLILTEWNDYRTPDFEQISQNLKNKLIFDGRNIYSLSKMQELGFTYYSIGRKTIYS
ncbi:MAG: UDP-glucose/GDP-mannose dehydrogenase family protein [Bacteroidia bacterium]|nr:UDP-glucose/GDP-mannose dehydrogenase family protein [Bacteroidia bacterium]MDW8301854.1 UDP-glucose/GDP-mannose dehydrogenase family protein [Bacteroidia bacterium]